MLKLITIVVFGLFLAACAPQTASNPGAVYQPAQDEVTPTSQDVSTQSTAAHGEKAAALLAKIAGLRKEDIHFVASQAKDWPDSCLGAAQPEEVCSQAISAGYQIRLESGGWEYILHTNQDLSVGRLAGPQEIIVATRARQVAAQEMNVALETVRLVKVGAVDWPDSCLGAGGQGMVCLQVITPGYQLTLESGGMLLEYHTNRLASVIMRKP